jgi:hypothetical protein
MFWLVMNRFRARMVEFVLLVAVVLPLQGFASASACVPFGSASLSEHCDHGAGRATGTGQHHGCGTCCSVAAISEAPQWQAAPRLKSPKLSLPLFWSLPAVVLDRLDRPPRLILA